MLLQSREGFETYLHQSDSGEYTAIYHDIALTSVYQPILDNNETIIGFEALLRLTDKNGITIPPNVFFQSDNYSFEHKLNVERLSRTIHIRNFAPYSCNQKLFLNVLPEAANLSLHHPFNNRLLANRLIELGLLPNNIILEIVEHFCLHESKLKQAVEDMKQRGFKIAIDDYGMDASCEARVSRLSPDILKMDRTLLLKYESGDTEPLLSAIKLAKTIQAKTIIEGIETKEQLNAVKQLDIDYFQGYYFGMPDKLPHSPSIRSL
ncbi:EAL domain-containing protein [Vibrio sp. Of7-15]|uniref:EAL domain-containing protein n=1 Tax=Vibrio sp. Of7-15 TaxID=2724879 RepID=UPI001EF36514|nr:EAL domain-containing protein [Vibrio sp. Of7-15]MCG7495288.1 EAL domain-containing protein [Vibrio sp. Of7-15]